MHERPTSTRERGIHIRPRLPDFQFDESLPRRYAGTGPSTAWVSMVSAFTTVAERMFIRSSAMLQRLVDHPGLEEELAAFMHQEAFHSSMHERLNKVQRLRGYPVEGFQAYIQDMMEAAVEEGGHRMMVAMALAGEQANGVFSDAILDHPQLLAAWDERVRRMFQWHAYEEIEHTAPLFDSFIAAVDDEQTAYRLRMWGVAYLAALILPSWSIGLYLFLEGDSAGAGSSAASWRELGAFLFGERGLLRGNDENMVAYLRRDFHPWQGRDAQERLRQHQEHARAEWDVSERRRPHAPQSGAVKLDLPTLRAPVSHAREALRFARFSTSVGARTARFVRDALRGEAAGQRAASPALRWCPPGRPRRPVRRASPATRTHQRRPSLFEIRTAPVRG